MHQNSNIYHYIGGITLLTSHNSPHNIIKQNMQLFTKLHISMINILTHEAHTKIILDACQHEEHNYENSFYS